jgi:hypothetical protein
VTGHGANVEQRKSGLSEAFFTSGGLASLAGVFAAILWGGIGGRIAMRVLFLTSPDEVKGVTSDAGFEIGTVSFDTIVLFVFAAIVGGVAGFAIGLARMVTPGPLWLVSVGVGVASGAFFGALLVTPEGIDFRVLEPLWLAIALFVALPALWGSTTILLARYLARPGVLFPTLPQRYDDRVFGQLGWAVLGFFTLVGTVLLAVDIEELS